MQGGLSFQPADYGHLNMSNPVMGVILNVFSADDSLNEAAKAFHDHKGSFCAAKVLVLQDGTDSPILLPNVIILPPSGSGHDDYAEETPRGTTGTIDGSVLKTGYRDVPPWKLNGDWCVSPETKILCSDLTWKKACDVTVGQELVGFNEDLKDKKLKGSVVEAVKKLIKPCVKITTTKGSIVCSKDHMWVIRKPYGNVKNQAGKCGWVKAEDAKEGDQISYFTDPWEVENSHDAGYLAGFFDGEGWISPKKWRSGIGFGQNPGPVLDKILALLSERGFNFTKKETRDYTSFNPATYRCEKFKITGLSRPSLRFLGSIRPTRLLTHSRFQWEGASWKGPRKDIVKILSVEDVGDQEVIAIQTSTRTFIADGYLSHNCVCLFLGGSIHMPIMINYFPHPGNRKDPCTNGTSPDSLIQGRRIAKRFQGTRAVLTSKGSLLLDTSKAGHALEDNRLDRKETNEGGDIKLTVKTDRELEVNFNKPVFDENEPDFLWDRREINSKEDRDDTATRLLMNKDFIRALAGQVVEIASAQNIYLGTQATATENFVLGQELKSLLITILNALISHKHPTGVGPSGPPLPPELSDFTSALSDVNAETILSTWIYGQKDPP